MKQAATAVTTATTEMKAGFASAAAADQAVISKVQESTAASLEGFAHIQSSGIFAFDAVRAKMIEATAEVARLRSEILATNDAAKLTQLETQLARATKEMTAARTEMRALRMEAAEATEKADLMGDALGVKVPGALGRLAGRIPAVQSLMASAFSIAVIGVFVQALFEVYEAFEKVSDAVVGYTEEVKKANEENVKFSREAEVHVASVADAHRKLQGALEITGRLAQETLIEKMSKGAEVARSQQSAWWAVIPPLQAVIGLYKGVAGAIQGVDRAADEETRAVQDAIEIRKRLLEQQAIETKEKVKSLEGEEAVRKVGESRLAQLGQEIAALKVRGKLEEDIAAKEAGAKPNATGLDLTEARAKVRQEYHFKILKLQKEFGVAEVEEDSKNNEAKITAQKEYDEALIGYEQSEYRRRFALGEISLEQEITLLQDSERRKFDIEEAAFEKLRALKLREGAATGKNVVPEIEAMDAKISQSRIETNKKINELDEQLTTGQIRRTRETTDAEIAADLKITESRLKATEEQQKFELSHADSVREVETAASNLIKTQTALFESQFQSVKSKADVLVASLSQGQRPTAQFGTNDFAKQLEAIKTLKPEIYAQLLELNAQEIALHNQAAAEAVRIENEKDEKIKSIRAKDAEQELQLALTTSNRTLEQSLKIDNDRLAHHQIMLGKWQQEELTALNTWYAAQLQALTRAEAAAEASFGKESAAYKKLKNQETELDQQYSIKAQQINQKIADSWQQMTSRISNTFTASVNSVVTGQEKIGQAALKLGQSLELYIIDSGIKKVVTVYGTQLLQMLASHSSFLSSLLGIQTTGNTAQIAASKVKQVAEVSANAGEAGAAGFASVMEALPFPANVAAAPGVAASAASATEAYIAFEKGGIIPGKRGEAVPIIGHAGEAVLPQRLSTFLNTAANTSIANSASTTNNTTNNTTSRGPSINHHHYNIRIDGAMSKGDIGQMVHEAIIPAIKRAHRVGSLP